ncbi:MAG: hypothetical protein ACI8QD_000047 [Cyclobacteriaceae bacterium]|jgi:hypothetical protein
MFFMRYFPFLVLMLLYVTSCQTTGNELANIIHADQYLNELASDVRYEVQVLYTQIDRDSANNPSFRTFDFHVDSTRYFYPGSTVKLPAVLLALEKLNELNIPGLDRNAHLRIDSSYLGQTTVLWDSTASDFRPSIGLYAKKILAVSDNDAFNRLYEFIGQDLFNQRLKEKGYDLTRIAHRLSISLSKEQNAATNGFVFYNSEETLYDQPPAVGLGDYQSNVDVVKGKAYQKDDEIVREPFVFTGKNAFALKDQHQMIKAIFFPKQRPQAAFNLTDEQLDFVRKHMHTLPRNTNILDYQSVDQYWDAYGKFLMYGSEPGITIPDNIRIYNKIGLAYGFAIDNAYIIDVNAEIEFMISAVIHTNANHVYNDGLYEYEEVAFPFMARLGMKLYQYELERKRNFQPDFTYLIK